MNLGVILLTTLLLVKTKGNYVCICNYNVEQSVLPYPDTQAIPLGYLYEFDCKSIVHVTNLNTQQWRAIAYIGQIGYIEASSNIQETMCPGFVSKEDLITTSVSQGQRLSTMPLSIVMTLISSKIDFSTVRSRYRSTTPSIANTPEKLESGNMSSYSTTSKEWNSKNNTLTITSVPESSTVIKQSSIPTTNKDKTSRISVFYPSATLMTTLPVSKTIITNVYTLPTTYVPTLPPVIDDITLCSPILLQYTKEDEGALTQYGNKCYELVPFKLIWTKAELDCRAKGGHLLTVQTTEFKNYIYTWIKTFSSIPAVWLGISDRRENGWFEWTSGEKLISTYWVQESTFTNRYDDCGIMLLDDSSKGGWKSVSCGETTPKGDRGSQYAFICEYSTKTQSIGAGVIGR